MTTTKTGSTTKINGFTVEVLSGRTVRRPDLRTVYIVLPYVDGGRTYELTSFRGGEVELYVVTPTDPPRYVGSPRRYFPGETNSVRDMLRTAWLREQPSAAARVAFPE